MNRGTWTTLACVTLAAIFLGFIGRNEYRLVRSVSHPPDDFAVYYVAGKLLISQHNAQLYYPLARAASGQSTAGLIANLPAGTEADRIAHASGIDGVMPFTYPPFAAVIAAPLALLPAGTAYVFWRELSLVLVLASVYLILRLLRTEPMLPIFVVAAAAALAFFPVEEMLDSGQVGGLLLFLWTCGAYLLHRGRSWGSALCFALGAMIKITPVLVVPLLLIRRQWSWLLAYCSWIGAFFTLALWRSGWDNHWVYFSRILPSISCGFPGYANKSLAALVENLYFGQVPHTMAPVIIPAALCYFNKALGFAIYAAVLFVLWRINRNDGSLVFEVVLLVLVSLLISPVSWRHHYVLAILPLLWLWIAGREENSVSMRLHFPVLVVTTITLATPFPDYLVLLLHRRWLEIPLAGSAAVLTLLLVATVLFTMRETAVAHRTGHAAGGTAVPL